MLRSMRIIRSFESWPQAAHGSVMALGNFDGMHRGHQAVIARAESLARAQNRPCAVMTFDPHPRRFFKPELPVLRVIPFAQKAQLMRNAGVDFLYVARFNRAFSELAAEEYLLDVLQEKLKVAHIVTGHDFAFGKGRRGNAAFLQNNAPAYTSVEAVDGGGGEVFSSTGVRHALEAGDVEKAAQILGRPYVLRGSILHGDKRGRTIGFPTANLRPVPLFLPRFGVYAVRMKLAGKWHEGVANLGVRPTFGSEKPTLETHLFDFDGDIYGQRVEVELRRFIRAEQKFSGLEELKSQIARDGETARGYFKAEKESAI